MNDQKNYFEYLRGRSLLGFLYRKLWLYPRLAREVSGRVLDVGCGIGDFMTYRPGTVGVDVSTHTVDWCCQRGLNAKLMEPDNLPFEDGSFESVVLDNVLEHLSEPQALLADIRRVLTPSGLLLVGVPGKKGYARDPDHKIFYGEADLVRVMNTAGLNKLRIFHMPLKSVWLADRLPQYCLYGVFVRS